MDMKLYAHHSGDSATAVEAMQHLFDAARASAARLDALEPEKPQYDYDLRVSRSYGRLKTGEIAFECKYGDDAPVKVPITAFFDQEGWCTDFEVCQAINNWCAKATQCPNVRRKCLICNRKAVKGVVTCGVCDKKWGAAIYAD